MKTINLLPKIRQQELYYDGILQNILMVIILSACSFGLVFVLQFGAKFYLQNQLASTKNSIEQLKNQVNKEDNAVLKQQITQINNTVLDYKNLAAAAPQWSRLIKAFAPLPPSNVQINSFVVDSSKTVTINGFSPSREGVIQLYNNILKDSEHFSNIDYPFENVAHATDVSFHFTFNIQPGLLQNK